MKKLIQNLVLVVATTLPATAQAGVVCSLGASGNMRVCCDAGCGPFAVGCAGAEGNYQTGNQYPVGAACPSLADRGDIGPGPGSCDPIEDAPVEEAPLQDAPMDRLPQEEVPLYECDAAGDDAEILTRVSAAADYLRTDLVDEMWQVVADAPDQADAIEDAIEELAGHRADVSRDGAADKFENGQYTAGMKGVGAAVEALLDAEGQNADVTQLVDWIVDAAFITMVAIIDEAQVLGVDPEEIDEAWAAYDEAAAELVREASDPAGAVDLLGKSAGFGSGTRQSTTKTNSKPELL